MGETRPRVLFVDDEPDLLAAMVRNLRSDHFAVFTAQGGKAALEVLRNAGKFAVIVSDLRMPEMDGVTFLRLARGISPDTVRVLFTGTPDTENAIAAVNEGEVFRFMVKPCPRTIIAMNVKAALEQHRLITAERVLLEQTLHGSIKALTDILSLSSPLAFGRATRLRQSMRSLVAALQVSGGWHVEVAAMLSQIGYVILPPATLERVYQGEVLSSEEEAMMRRVPAIVEQVLGNIPRMEPVLEILRFQHRHLDGREEDIPWGARALKVILDLDALEAEGLSTALAFDTMRGREGWYDRNILEALAQVRKGDQCCLVRELPLARLCPGMVLAQDVRTNKGALFIARGQEVTASLLEKLKNFAPGILGGEMIRVIVPNPPPDSVA